MLIRKLKTPIYAHTCWQLAAVIGFVSIQYAYCLKSMSWTKFASVCGCCIAHQEELVAYHIDGRDMLLAKCQRASECSLRPLSYFICHIMLF